MSVERRIRTDIERRIHSGEWRPGDRIPFEHQLVIAYGCSRATVSKALTSLARDGLIERRRKAGSFVAHPQAQSAVLEVPDLAQIIAARGEEYRWQLTRRCNTAPASDEQISTPALLVEGIHFGGGFPFAIERRLISLRAVPEATEADFAVQAPGSWLLRHAAWTSARHEIRAVPASRAEAGALAVAKGMACLELDRITWQSGRPVTHVRQLFRGDQFHLAAEFRPGANDL